MAGYVCLNAEQLRGLASVIYYQEAEALKNINFDSESERAKYLNFSQACYKSVLDLLDGGAELVSAFQDDTTKAPIATEIFSYILNSLNFALQYLNNYLPRLNYLDKIKEHGTTLTHEVKELEDNNVTAAAALSKKAVGLNQAMLKYANLYRSELSLYFSKSLKEAGVMFNHLLQSYTEVLQFEGQFKDLKAVQKIRVYDEILRASGLGRICTDMLLDVLDAAGKALILLTAGLMVWDIFSSDHIIEKATRDAVLTAASIGIVGGLVGAFILGEFAGQLMDVIFGSGGATLSTEGYRCYVASMPDGQVLARQIAHN